MLVVDDEMEVRLLCSFNLTHEGYQVVEARDGAEALEIVSRERPDVILLDVMMPNMDGWEVLDSLKRDPVMARVPIIMLTARAQETDQVRGWKAGADGYITKPFNPTKLGQAIEAVRQSKTAI